MPDVSTELSATLWTTLRVSAGAILLVLPAGIALGFLLARARFSGRSLIETLVALPLVLPPTAIGYLLLSLLARDGVLGERVLGVDLDILFTWRAACIASAVMALPLVARTARTAFEEVDPRLESMARSLGFSRTRTFLVITLPLAHRGLAAAAFLGFGRALGEFGATVIVAGNIPGRTQTLALAIFEGIQLGDESRVRTLTLITLVLALGLVFLAERLSRAPRGAAERRA